MRKLFGFTLLIALLPFSMVSAQKTGMVAETFTGLSFRSIGPALQSGRIADIAIHPEQQSTWYVAVGSGGVWKTTNSGTTWTPIFDGEASYSIGCVTLDPDNPEVVWVGTGENVSGRHVGYGDGVYKSLDGGASWSNMGLKGTQHISKILVDPRDSDIIYVAAEGPLWNEGGERGIFKTTDGGKNWQPALQISKNTGVIDIAFDPRDAEVIYAASYQRRRTVAAFLAGGPESGIYKSTNAGGDWRKLTSGLPKGDMGRIGLAVSPIDPDIVYATIEASKDERGFYRSENSGERWEKRNEYVSGGTGPHYYQEIFASPHKLDRVYQMDVYMRVTDDGGKTFRMVGEEYKHVDNHALAFDPNDPDYLLAGCDGGLYETWDHGKAWKYVSNLPVTQFYKMALDNDYPFYNIVGGTQDNNTQLGPSRTRNVHGIRNSDWVITVGGDGYACQIDPDDPNTVYSEWQYGGLTRFDRRTGELINIKPQPAPGDAPERWNWDAPILISPHSSTRLYFGSQRLWRSDDRGDSWTPISGDLSRGVNRYELKMMDDRVWSVDDLYDNYAMSWFSNTTAISESPLVEGLIYVGTDDGLIQVTEDGGSTWRRIERFAAVPEMSFVNEIKASVHDAGTVFAVFDNHKVGDFKPYLVKSTDRGRTWTSIASDLPDRHIVWSVEQDHIDPDLLFAGTEFGIFFTVDGGRKWLETKGGLPTIAFRDMEIQRREDDLVGATFGRGFYVLDDYSPLREMDEATLSQEAKLFGVKDALLYVPAVPLGLKDKADEGAAFYTAANPPFGAVFTYYLRDSLKTSKEVRREQEAAIRKRGGDVPFPGYEKLEAEDRETEPAVVLVVRNASGEIVRRITGERTPGFHRTAWNLRYPAYTPTEVEKPDWVSPWADQPTGPMVAPGSFTVVLAKMVDGGLQEIGERQSFSVRHIDGEHAPTADRSEVLAFQKRTGELQRQALAARGVARDVAKRIPYLRQALLDAPRSDAALLERLRRIELELADVRKLLEGDPTVSRLSEASVPSVLDRISSVVGGHWETTHPPTATHRKSYDYAASAFEAVKTGMRKVQSDVDTLERDMETAGAPWTPGRQIPER